MAGIDVNQLSGELEKRLGEKGFVVHASAAEFDPITANPDVVNIVMNKGKPHIYFDPRDITLNDAVPVQKKRPVITLVNTTGEEKNITTLESTTIDGKLTESVLPIGSYLNVEIPPIEHETITAYDERVNTLLHKLESLPHEKRFEEVFAMGAKGEVNLYSPPVNKFSKLYLDVPQEIPELGKYTPKPEPRDAYRVNFDALVPVPDAWRENKAIDTVPNANRTMVTDAGSVLVLIDLDKDPHLVSERYGRMPQRVLGYVKYKLRDKESGINHWELGKPDAYFVAGSASGTYARAGDEGVTPPALFTIPLAKNIEAAVQVIASLQPERADVFATQEPSTTYDPELVRARKIRMDSQAQTTDGADYRR